MIVTVEERLRLLHELDQLEGAMEECYRLVQEIAGSVLCGDLEKARELKARVARLHEYAVER